jgi:hypothetical protein
MIIGFASGASGHRADEKVPGMAFWLGPGSAGARGSF